MQQTAKVCFRPIAMVLNADKRAVTDRKPGGGLPLTNLATANSSQTTLPPYTAPAAGAGFDYTPQGMLRTQQMSQAQQAAATQIDQMATGAVPGSVLDRAASVSRHNRERDQEAAIDDEPPSTPFSPFAPFSPVSATHGPPTLQHSVSRASLNSHAPYKPSNLQHGVTLTPPSSGIQYDPDAAQSMGIHPNVLAQAETGASEDEIERRRARAQRRLEEQQRRDEGQYDDGRESSSTSGGFRSMARSREVIR